MVSSMIWVPAGINQRYRAYYQGYGVNSIRGTGVPLPRTYLYPKLKCRTFMINISFSNEQWFALGLLPGRASLPAQDSEP